jgi:hypothetical protein
LNYDIVTILDCIEAYEKRGWGVILEDGHVTGFERKEELA